MSAGASAKVSDHGGRWISCLACAFLARFVTEAVAAGVRRLALLSAPGVDADDSYPLEAVEQAVRGCGAEWTILRPTWFSQNYVQFW